MKKKQLLIALIMGVFFMGLSYAQENTAQALPVEPSYQDENSIIIQDTQAEGVPEEQGGDLLSFWDVARMILIFAAVLLVIYLIFYFLKKAGGPRFQDSGLIKMHASLGLGPNRSLHLIEVGQEIFLVGAAEESVSLISKIDSKESLDDIRFRISTEKTEPEGKTFSAVFSGLFKREKPDVNVSRSLSRSRNFLEGQKERLKKM